MNIRALIIGLILSIPLAWYAGYWMGKSLYKDTTSSTDVPQISSSHQAIKDESVHPSAQNKRQSQGVGEFEHAVEETGESADAGETIQSTQTAQEPVRQDDAVSGLARTGEMLADRQGREHFAESREFENSFSEDDEDWQAKTNFTDFLQLHENAHLIELHKIICSSERCQLIGQFDAEHKQWEQVINDMKEQDWWNYTGTSSSSSTRDGVTYFNLYVNKPTN